MKPSLGKHLYLIHLYYYIITEDNLIELFLINNMHPFLTIDQLQLQFLIVHIISPHI